MGLPNFTSHVKMFCAIKSKVRKQAEARAGSVPGGRGPLLASSLHTGSGPESAFYFLWRGPRRGRGRKRYPARVLGLPSTLTPVSKRPVKTGVSKAFFRSRCSPIPRYFFNAGYLFIHREALWRLSSQQLISSGLTMKGATVSLTLVQARNSIPTTDTTPRAAFLVRMLTGSKKRLPVPHPASLSLRL